MLLPSEGKQPHTALDPAIALNFQKDWSALLLSLLLIFESFLIRFCSALHCDCWLSAPHRHLLPERGLHAGWEAWGRRVDRTDLVSARAEPPPVGGQVGAHESWRRGSWRGRPE